MAQLILRPTRWYTVEELRERVDTALGDDDSFTCYELYGFFKRRRQLIYRIATTFPSDALFSMLASELGDSILWAKFSAYSPFEEKQTTFIWSVNKEYGKLK